MTARFPGHRSQARPTGFERTGERLLGGGFVFTNPGNREAAWLQALPVVGGETHGVAGRITTNSGGTATAEVAAICLR